MPKYIRKEFDNKKEGFNPKDKYLIASREGIEDWRDFSIVYVFMAICIAGFVFFLSSQGLISFIF